MAQRGLKRWGLALACLSLHSIGHTDTLRCIAALRDDFLDDARVARYLDDEIETLHFRLEQEREAALKFLLENILPNGAIMAATSASRPNYRFHWRRDAAIVYSVLWNELRDEGLLHKMAESEWKVLTNVSPGEPKVHSDLTPFTDFWGRPQNDGPALSVLALLDYANLLLKRNASGDLLYLKNHLYSSESGKDSLIKMQADYIAHNHSFNRDFEPWEEDSGQHFYNGLAQVKALRGTAELARKLSDFEAADFYIKQAEAIEERLGQHWDEQQRVIIPTLNRPWDSWFHDKVLPLDIQILLAYLHTQSDVNDSRLMSSFQKLRASFKESYPINQRPSPFKYAVAMGRYIGDAWDGVDRTGGNPWFLATFGSGEFLFRLAHSLEKSQKLLIDANNVEFLAELVGAFDSSAGQAIREKQGLVLKAEDALFQSLQLALKKAGDEFLMLGLSHGGRDARLSEQFNRDSGLMQGAENLTWSYASLLSALQARRLIYGERSLF